MQTYLVTIITADSPTGSADPYNDMFEWFSATELKWGGHIGAVASCGIWNYVKNLYSVLTNVCNLQSYLSPIIILQNCGHHFLVDIN